VARRNGSPPVPLRHDVSERAHQAPFALTAFDVEPPNGRPCFVIKGARVGHVALRPSYECRAPAPVHCQRSDLSNRPVGDGDVIDSTFEQPEDYDPGGASRIRVPFGTMLGVYVSQQVTLSDRGALTR